MMKKSRLLLLATVICLVALILPMAVSAEEATRSNGWVNNQDGTWSYWLDGDWVEDEVIKVGQNTYYAFDDDGYMITDDLAWSQYCYKDGNDCCWKFGYVYAEKDGKLRQNGWFHDTLYDDWYYFGSDAMGVDDFQKIGNTWYFFSNGYMVTDTAVYSFDYGRCYAISKDGTDSKYLPLGWTHAFGEDYYVYEDDGSLTPANEEIIDYAGKQYYLDSNNQMVSNQLLYINGKYHLATADGSLLHDGWAQVNRNWYFAADGSLFMYGVLEIGDKLYYFSDYRMVNVPGEYGNYYITGDGSLCCNQWRYITTGDDDPGYVYYDESGQRVYGFQEINGVTYFFLPTMQTNYTTYLDDQLWYFDSDGKGKELQPGWFQDSDGDWYYIKEDGSLAQFELLEIGGKLYGFTWGGHMVCNGYIDDCLFDQNGNQITTPGWHIMDGSYYFVNTDGTLFSGWKQSGSNWYFLWPQMYANTVFEDPENVGVFYYANNDGVTTRLTGSGWQVVDYATLYLENGKPVMDAWRWISGSWYYFDSDGSMLTDTYATINEKDYLFDTSGRMYTNGWAKISDETYYVVSDGVLMEGGLHTIDGKQYLFREDHSLMYSSGYIYDILKDDGKYYWFNADGSVRAELKDGWNEVSGKWYYLKNGKLLQNALLLDNNDVAVFGFGSDCAMCTNGVKYAWSDYYIFDAEGHILTGWQKVDGKWYYANPEHEGDPYITTSGIYYINGKPYAFENGTLKIGTFYMDGVLITTDADGVAIKYVELKDGWNYVGNGYVYFLNADIFSGWVGNYYVQNGWMLTNQRLEYGGKYYWLGADGQYVRNKWIAEPFIDGTDYYYADANGILACNEWKQIGGKWYYFQDSRMVSGDDWYIDGAYHDFDENGVWLGEISPYNDNYATRSDGWQYIGGDWYYYHAGQPVFGRQYIGGKWYFFDYYEATMCANSFVANWGDGTVHYYTASGAQADYVGWKQIDGEWCYFNADSTVRYGWLKSGNGWYYLDYAYNDNGILSCMLSNTGYIENGVLYLFDANGYCTGATTKDGWHQAGSNWYYVQNGRAVRNDYLEIGNDMYCFDEDGCMVTNAIGYGTSFANSGYCYYGADGKAVKTQGWKQTKNGWVYIGSDGLLYEYGIYRIGGMDYSFVNGFWVK